MVYYTSSLHFIASCDSCWAIISSKFITGYLSLLETLWCLGNLRNKLHPLDLQPSSSTYPLLLSHMKWYGCYLLFWSICSSQEACSTISEPSSSRLWCYWPNISWVRIKHIRISCHIFWIFNKALVKLYMPPKHHIDDIMIRLLVTFNLFL